MTNEQYLIVSYFGVGLGAAALATATYAWLRRSFNATVLAFPSRHFAVVLRRVFFIGLLFPALAGFFSVSFRSCSTDTYKKIIENRSYLVAKNHDQLSASMRYVAIALLIWGAIMLLGFVGAKRNKRQGLPSTPTAR